MQRENENIKMLTMIELKKCLIKENLLFSNTVSELDAFSAGGLYVRGLMRGGVYPRSNASVSERVGLYAGRLMMCGGAYARRNTVCIS